MKPFSNRGLTPSERIFNYRLSRARLVVENAFGMLSNRFRIFRHAIQLRPEVVDDIILAACALHNYLRTISTKDGEVDEDDIADIEPIHHIAHTPRDTGVNYNRESKDIRDSLAQYFVHEGQVPWQWKHANINNI